MLIIPIQQRKFSHIHFTSYIRDLNFTIYIYVISPDDDQNRRSKHVSYMRNKLMSKYLYFSVGLIIIEHIKSEHLFVCFIGVYSGGK
jgi:hypothetical protein